MNRANILEGPNDLILDLNRRAAIVNGEVVALQRREVDLLEVLLRERGRVVTFEELAQRAWGHSAAGDARFIYTAAWRVRRALEAAGASQVIQSVRGVGYSITDPEMAGEPDLELLPVIEEQAADRRAIAVFDPSDPDMPPSLVNGRAVELTGYAAETLTRVPEIWHRICSLDERTLLCDTLRYALRAGRATIRGRHLIRADNTPVTVDLTFSRLDGAGPTPLALVEGSPTFS